MPYMNCPRCGLSVSVQSAQASLESCPRCRGRDQAVVPMHLADHSPWPQEIPTAAVADADVLTLTPHQLFMSASPRQDGWVLALGGELDLDTFQTLSDRLEGLERDTPAHLVLDVREVGFVDSTGLGVIVAADLRARQAGRALTLVCGDGPVRRLLALTGLDGHLNLADATVVLKPVSAQSGESHEK